MARHHVPPEEQGSGTSRWQLAIESYTKFARSRKGRRGLPGDIATERQGRRMSAVWGRRRCMPADPLVASCGHFGSYAPRGPIGLPLPAAARVVHADEGFLGRITELGVSTSGGSRQIQIFDSEYKKVELAAACVSSNPMVAPPPSRTLKFHGCVSPRPPVLTVLSERLPADAKSRSAWESLGRFGCTESRNIRDGGATT